MNTAAERMSSVRNAFHMNRSQFADLLGISSTTVSLNEMGKSNITRKTAELIEEMFYINPEWLLHGEGERFCRRGCDYMTVLENHPEIKVIYDYKIAKREAETRKEKWKVQKAESRERMRESAAEMKMKRRMEKKTAIENQRNEAAERLKRFRNAYAINQNQLAKKLGYTRAYISAVEKGIQSPSAKMAELIEKEYGISAAWLRFGTADNAVYA